ncbi:MAG: hypothetical protein ACMZI0_00140 [Symbiopectobacterium sp.]|uniref:hypothetical protein n=1 Tax=Symbiopectobacterium sp. TaxID=2952789 RepID=UPI0039EC1334
MASAISRFTLAGGADSVTDARPLRDKPSVSAHQYAIEHSTGAQKSFISVWLDQ